MNYLKIAGVILLGVVLYHAWQVWGLLATAATAMIVLG